MITIERCKDYADAARAVRKAVLDAGGVNVKKGETILLKVNMLADKTPEEGVTTHPAVVEAVIDLVLDAGAIPIVGDSPFPLIQFKRVAEKTGMAELCRRKKVKLADLSTPKHYDNKMGKLVKSFELTKELDNVDGLIDICKLKTHTFMVYTGAVKNLFGLVSGKEKPALHLRFPDEKNFGQMLLDLYSALKKKTRLVVMDGVVGMEGSGPLAGDKRDIGLIFAGSDALELDLAVTEVLGIRKHVPYLKGLLAPSGINYREFAVKDFKIPKGRKGGEGMKHTARNLLISYPTCDKVKCIGCARCKGACPAGAIRMMGNKPKFDYSKCIRCYCCHEMCPEHAIFLKRPILGKIFKPLLSSRR